MSAAEKERRSRANPDRHWVLVVSFRPSMIRSPVTSGGALLFLLAAALSALIIWLGWIFLF
jgi:hypothetical protein